MEWTEERTNIAKTLWDEGHPASHIARILGVTRNAVIGKVTRLKLKPRLAPNENRFVGANKQRPRNTTKFNFATNAVKAEGIKRDSYVHRETVVAAEHERIPFEALEQFDRRCRYAHGDAPPYAYCGKRTVLATSWCPAHFEAVTGAPHPSQLSENPGELEAVTERNELEAVS